MEIITRKEAIKNGLKFFFTGKPCKKGHIDMKRCDSYACVKCSSEYAKNNKEIVRVIQKRYYEKNIENVSVYYVKNRDKILKNHKEWREKNKDKTRIYFKNRRNFDDFYRLKHNIGCLIRNYINKSGHNKKSKTTDILGCSYEEFKLHIEKQFTKGMSWENRSEWHIDHIVPLASAQTEEEVLKLNHFKNLRPLWAIDNLSKGKKLEWNILS